MNNRRANTDESLRIERRKADRDLRDTQTAERAADKVIDLARQQADAVVETDRARADEVLQAERAAADDCLRREREDGGRALAQLLPWEREHTDRDLLTERARSDDAIAVRDDFLAIVSHDLRNLLGGIVLASSSLLKRASEAAEDKQAAATGKRIQLYAARMNRLIGDLVDVTSMDAGKLACAIVPDDALALIAETVETFRRAAEDKDIVLESEVTGVLPPAAFDYRRMLQVLANLVSNALKFTPRGGTIRIRGERTGDEVRFSIGDTGPGIPEDMFDAVFLRFWQANPNDRRGTGLGLYICKILVEAHRGRIWIESKVGQGSVFHFTIPVLARA